MFLKQKEVIQLAYRIFPEKYKRIYLKNISWVKNLIKLIFKEFIDDNWVT